MANLPEEARWEEGVHQWEVTDPVMGGPDGIDNKPIRQLANRTKYLKEHLETGQSEIDKELKKRILTTAISSAIDSTSTDTVASSAAVKTAYDKAVQASNVAGGKIATTAISSSVTSTSNSTVASSGAV
ncbi:MAG: tail fiber protein [Gammaproteobacteria bacterium]|nr:tail fiber protein [Gammaproteobacteria bacterium]